MSNDKEVKLNPYLEFMAIQIAQEIGAIQDPRILALYMKAISAARCKIGGAPNGTCKGCLYQNYNCRQLTEIFETERGIFDEE